MVLRRTLLLLITLLVIISPAGAITQQFSPEADSWIDESDPFDTWGASGWLYNQNTPGDDSRSLFRFDLSLIPNGTPIVRATLHLYAFESDATGMPIEVRRVTENWDEATVSWSNAWWKIDGTDYGGFSPTTVGWHNCDVTGLVQEWIDQTHTNHGLTLLSTSNGDRSGFASRENSTVQNRPYLEIEFDDGSTGGMRAATGHYLGSGTGGRPIHETDFQPDVVIIKGDIDEYAVIRTSTMNGDLSKEFDGALAARGDLIQSLDADGFTIGSDDAVNNLDADFYWIAMKAAVGVMRAGTYNGDGFDDRSIPDVGFEPDQVFVLGEGPVDAVQVSNQILPGWSVAFGEDGATTNLIQTLQPDGFQVGDSPIVNEDGQRYHYVAWQNAPSNIQTGFYWPPGGPTTIDVGFQPDYVVIKSSVTYSGVHRPASLVGDASLSFMDFPVSGDVITGFVPNGFEIGNDERVSGSGGRFFWVAFRDAPSPGTTDLAIAKNVNNANPNELDTITYTLTLTNNGPGDATDIVVNDLLPPELSFVGSTASHGSYVSDFGVWAIDALADGEIATLDIDAQVHEGTVGRTITNVAEIFELQEEDALDTNDLASVDITVRENFRMATGSYIGNGSVSREILVGEFTPGFVLIKGDHDLPAVLRTASMTALLSKELGVTTAMQDNRIRSLNTAAFHVGSDPTVNAPDVTYYWTAIEVGNGRIFADTYTGNGQDNRSIDWVGFEPSYVIVASELNRHAMERFAGQPDDESYEFDDNDHKSDRIQNFEPTGFQLGRHDTVNKLDETYHFVAFRDAPGRVATGTYLGDGSDDRPIPDAGFEPLLVLLKINDGKSGVVKTDYLAGDQTLPLDDTGPAFTDGIQDLLPDGFEVGPDDRVNKDTKDVYWFAIWGEETAGADIKVLKTVDDLTPNEFDQVLFTIHVENLGPVAATGVEILDLLDSNLTYETHETLDGTYVPGTGRWSIGNLGNTASATLDITATVKEGTGGLTIPNEASVAALDQTDPNGTNDLDRVEIVVQSADLAVTKSVDDPEPNEGETIEFIVSLANLGPDAGTAIQLSDLLPTGLGYDGHSISQGIYNSGSGLWQVGTVAADSVATLSLTAVVDFGTGGDTIVNSASILAADQADPNGMNNTDTAEIQVQSADLALSMVVDNDTPNETETITYTISLGNQGPSDATGIIVTDLLPEGVTYDSHTASRGNFESATGEWSLVLLELGNGATLDLVCTVDDSTAGSSITNVAAITASEQFDPDPSNDDASSIIDVQGADLAITKVIDTDAPNEGETITYTVSVVNLGPDPATDVRLLDLLPSEVIHISDEATLGDYENGSGLWIIGSVGIGIEAILTIEAEIAGGTGGETIVNSANVSHVDQGDPDGSNNSASATCTVQSADLVLAKGIDEPFPNVGDTVRFTVAISNQGPDAATGISVTDLLPEGLNFDTYQATQGDYTDVDGAWSVGNLAPGADATLDLDVVIAAGTGGETIVNDATITAADQADPNPADNAVSAELTVQSADLFVLKNVDNATPSEGETVIFTVSLTNNGPDAATGITLTDFLPVGLTYATHETDEGTYTHENGLWVLGSLTLDASVDLRLSAIVDAGTGGETIVNDAMITAADQEDPNLLNNHSSSSIGAESADLGVTKSVDVPNPNEGDTVIFEVVLTNAGASDAHNVELLDALPEGLLYVTHETTTGTYLDDSGLWTIPDLPLEDSSTLTLTATVETGTGGETIVNTASILGADQADPNGSNNLASRAITVQSADLSISKVVDDAAARPGETVVFTVTLTNHGPDRATGIELLDQLPEGLTHQSSDADPGSYSPTTGLWTIDSLEDGDAATLSITALIDEDDMGTTLLRNTATVVSSDQPDPNEANNSDDAEVTLIEAVLVSALPQGEQTVHPGGERVDIFGFRLTNGSSQTELLTEVSIENTTDGPGNQTQLDSNWTSLTLLLDDPPDRETVGTADFVNGAARFDDLSVALPAGESIDLIVEAGASLVARDSDALDLKLDGASDLDFSRELYLEGSFPLDPVGSFPIDGMVREQLTLHPIIPGLIVAGETDRLALDLTVPANGYQADLIQQIRLRNEGTAIAVDDLMSVRVWVDGGNGAFDAGSGDDEVLGTAGWDGAYWTLAGLHKTIPEAGLRFYTSVDVDTRATEGRTIRFGLPAAPFDGVTVASDNDGPIDEPVLEPETMTIVADPDAVIRISAEPQTEGSLHPAGESATILRIRIDNDTAIEETLETLMVENATEGVGDVTELDASWSTLTLIEESDAKFERTLASAELIDGSAVFDGLDTPIAPGTSVSYRIEAGASLGARDGDRLDLRIRDAESIALTPDLPIEANWPLDPNGSFPVDGMVSEQLTLHPIPAGNVFNGETDILVFDFEVPANGYESDLLEQIDLVALGDADYETDIDGVRLWTDSGNGRFDAGAEDDSLLGVAAIVDSKCSWIDLGLPIPVEGRRLFASVDLTSSAREGYTLRYALPTYPGGGVVVASANDGPIDRQLVNPELLTILEVTEDALTVAAVQPPSQTLLPGAEPIEIYRIRILNFTARAEQIRSIALANTTEGPGGPAELDADWSACDLIDLDDTVTFPDSLVPIATATMSEGQLRFSNLSIDLPVRGEVNLAFYGGASLTARDGDRLDLRLETADDISFAQPVTLTASGSLDPYGAFTVDGMAADQIALHPVETTAVPAGSTRGLVFDLTLPANGYETDQLYRFDFVNLGTAQSGSDLNQVEAWLDDGDGAFDASQETLLGSMRYTGNRWEITALSVPVPLEGVRVFATADIDPLAVGGRTVRFSLPTLPDVGVGMESDNDGPLDRALENPISQVITSVDRITMTAETVPSGIVYPGDRDVALLHLTATNTHETERTISGLTFENGSTGSGEIDDLDTGFEVLLLREDGNGNGQFDDPSLDPVIGTATFNSGRAAFRGLQWQIDPEMSRHLFLTTHVSLRNATDGDILAANLGGGFDVEFLEPAAIAADWPIDSGARWIVDGMVSRQVGNFSTGVATLGPGEGPQAALDLLIPANGYVEDALESVRIVNLGTAGPNELEEIRFWRDGGNGAFDSGEGDDLDLGPMPWDGEEWSSSTLDERLQLGGGRFYVSIQVTETLLDSSSVRLAVPLDGLRVTSENDGPIDERIVSPDAILLSSACLLTTLESDPCVATVGQEIAVRMRVQNRGQETIRSISPIALEPDIPENLLFISGPEPGSLSLEPDSAETFEWIFSGVTPGDVRLTGSAEGIGDETGLSCSSLGSTSSTIRVLREAQTLQMFAVGSLPFTVTRGQAGVIPLSLTFRNTGGDDGSNINLTGLTFRLEDQNGTSILPSDLITRVVVNEGNRIYLNQAIHESAPDQNSVELRLTNSVLVTTFEPVTMNVQLDLSPETLVSDFRVVILEGSWFAAEDATNRAPVGVDLQETTFPIRSGLARIVAEATAVDVSEGDRMPARVSPGQAGVELLELSLENVGITGITSDARVGSFAFTILDENDLPLANPATYLERLHIESSLQLLGEPTLSGSVAESLLFDFDHPLNLPVNTAISLRVTGDLTDSIRVGSFRVVLEDPTSMLVWDAITRNAVTVSHTSPPIEGGIVLVEAPATTLHASGSPSFPPTLSVGERDVPAIELSLEHPGSEGTARIRIDGFTMECWNKNRDRVSAGVYLDRVRVLLGDEELVDVTDIDPSDASVWIPLAGRLIEPGETFTAQVIVDVEADAPESFLEIAIRGSEIAASDANGGLGVDVEAAEGTILPLFSGMTHLRSPAREMFVAMESRIPAALVSDGQETPIALLTCSNPATDGSGSIRLDHLLIGAGDDDGLSIPIGSVASSVVLYVGGERWAQSSPLSPESNDARIVFPGPLELPAGESTVIEARVCFREDPSVETVRFTWTEDDFGIIQPEGAIFSVDARPAKGFAFPLTTQSGTFTGNTLEESFSNYPNPFAAGSEITGFVFYLPSSAKVSLRIFTPRGDAVNSLLESQEFAPGLHQGIRWDGRNGRGSAVRNGLYIAELLVQFDDGTSERLLRKVAVVR